MTKLLIWWPNGETKLLTIDQYCALTAAELAGAHATLVETARRWEQLRCEHPMVDGTFTVDDKEAKP